MGCGIPVGARVGALGVLPGVGVAARRRCMGMGLRRSEARQRGWVWFRVLWMGRSFFFFLAWGVRLGRLTHPRDGSLQGLEVGRSGWTNRCFAEGVLNETAGCRSVSCSLSMLHALIPTELVSMACLLRNCSLEGPVVDCGVTCCATVYGSEPEQGCLLVQYPVSSPFTEQRRRDVAVGWWCSPPPVLEG